MQLKTSALALLATTVWALPSPKPVPMKRGVDVTHRSSTLIQKRSTGIVNAGLEQIKWWWTLPLSVGGQDMRLIITFDADT